jgi:hypothetical protein
MTFGENGYRTVKENPVLALIAATGKGFRNKKTGKAEEIFNLSGVVPLTDKSSNQIKDFFYKVYPLRQIIKQHK